MTGGWYSAVAGNPVISAQPLDDLVRDRVDAAHLAQDETVPAPDLRRDVAPGFGVVQVAVFGAEQVVSLSMLVQEPADLVGMLDVVGGKLERDEAIDALPVDLGEVG